MTSIRPASPRIEAAYPLSPMQRGMLFHALYAPDADSYVEQVSAQIDGPLDPRTFHDAWVDLTARHAVLRTSFHTLDRSEPAQLVHRTVTLPWVDLDWRDVAQEEQERRWEALLARDERTSIPTDQAPLARITLVRFGEQTHRLVWTHHHLLLDGWSVPLVLRDLGRLYAARGAGDPTQLAPPPDYRAFLDWLRRQDSRATEQFWRERLAGFDTTTPVPRTSPASGDELISATNSLELDEPASEALIAFARANGLTLGTLMQAAWAIVLGRIARTNDVVFGVTVAGRPADLPGADETVGLFINTVPVRIRMSPATPALTWLRSVQAELATQKEWEHASLIDIQGWTAVPRGNALFDSIVVHENQPMGASELGRLGDLTISRTRATARTNYPIALVSLPGPRYRLQIVRDPNHVDSDLADALLRAVGAVLRRFVDSPTDPVGRIALVAPQDRRRVVAAGVGAVREYPADATLFAEFVRQATRTPDAVAVLDGAHQISYAALLAQARRASAALRSAGVGPSDRVGIVADRSRAFVAAMLGILAAGGTYVPLDPDYPQQRLVFMAADACVTVIVGSSSAVLADIAAATGVAGLSIGNLLQHAPGAADHSLGGPAPAYLMYTSGSTGTPKGIEVPQRGVLRLIRNTDYISLSNDDRVAFASNTAFDAATFEIWGALLQGAVLTVIARDELLAPAALARALQRTGVSAMFVTTSLFTQISAAEPTAFARLRTLIFGGEAIDPSVPVRILQSGGAPRRLVHAYGPTETTTFATWHLVEVGAKAGAPVPIGKALANSSAYVLDGAGHIAPDHVTGEVFLGGAGLAHGYTARAALTAERFVPDPYSDVPGARLYRTGDLVRRSNEGLLTFAGRTDHQVKLRGHRIELGDIEVALREHDDVTDAVAVLRGEGETSRLIAYIVPRTEGLSAADLRTHCLGVLPKHSVPSAYVLLGALPLTANQKIDRSALPAPQEQGAESAPIGTAPREGIESILASMWAELLSVPAVAADDNFFDLGGHSLLATRLQVRVRATLGIQLPLRALFESADLRDFAAQVAKHRGGGGGPGDQLETPLAASDDSDAPMSYAQQRLWFLEQWDPGTALYHITGAVRLLGSLSAPRLRAALEAVAHRHSSLRTSFVPDGAGGTRQQVSAPGPINLPIVDLEAEIDTGSRLDTVINEVMRTPFDLAFGPLWRTGLVRLGPEDHVFTIALHHLIADGRSMDILLDDLARLLRGEELAALPTQYTNYARWEKDPQRQDAFRSDLEYWRGRLEDVPETSLPPDLRPTTPTLAAATEIALLEGGANRRLDVLAGRTGTTPFMAALAIFAVALAQNRDLGQVVIGTPIANRPHRELEDVIGLFVNTLVLRLGVSPDGTFLDLLGRARDVCLDAYDHQAVPYERVVGQLRSTRASDRQPLFQTWFVLHERRPGESVFPGLTVQAVSSPDHLARYHLRLDLQRVDDHLRAVFEYRADLFEPASMARLARRFTAVFDEVTADPSISLAVLAQQFADSEATLRQARRTTVTLSSLNRLQTTRRRAVGPTDDALNGEITK